MLGKSGDIGNIFGFSHRVSWRKKKAHDFRWAEEMADYYDFYYGQRQHNDEVRNMLMNYDLYNGRGNMDIYNSDPMFFWNLGDESIEIEHSQVQHHDIISKIAKAMVGEQRKRPLSPMAVDSSRYTMNARKRKKLELLQEWLQNEIINPIREQAMMQVMQQMGVQDPFSLSPEQQDQMQQQVEQQVQAMTPKEIVEYMRKDYKSPEETQAQKLIDYLMKELRIKELTDEGFKHGLITGKEIYKVGILHGRPTLEIVNPTGFTWSGASNTMFIEDGEWAKYEQTIKYTDVFNKYGDILTAADIKKLDSLFVTGTGSNTSYHKAEIESKLVSVVSSDPREMAAASSVDIRNQRGQEYLNELYQRSSTALDPRSNIREVHIVYKSLRKLKNIKRIDFATGKVSRYWVDEVYEFNPAKGDIEEQVAWVPEVWEVTKIGYVDAIYLNKRPVPGQYRSLKNPFDVKLPYVGVEYGRLMGNSKNVSVMDLGKPWQYKFNVQMARLQELEATDVGKILLTTLGAKPKDWTWQQFYQTIRYGKMGILDLMQEGTSGLDANVFKGIDLSNAQDIANKLQYLEFLKNQVAEAMSYNPSRLGEISPYTAVRNNQQNIMQSAHQTEDIFTTHNIVVENLLNVIMNTARVAYKENPDVLSYILDDMSRGELELDWELLQRSEIGIYIRNSGDDFQNLDFMKQNLQNMLQNGLISFPEFAKVIYAKNGAEVINIAEDAQARLDRMRQEEAQQQQAMAEQQAKMQEQLLRLQVQLDTVKELTVQQPRLEVEREKAALAAMQFANQKDIDANKVNDEIQKQREDNEFKAKESEKDRKLEKELTTEKLKVEKMKANKPKSSA